MTRWVRDARWLWLFSSCWLLYTGSAAGQSTFAVAAPGGAAPHQTQLHSATPDWVPGLRTQAVAPPQPAGHRSRLAALKDSLKQLQQHCTGPAAGPLRPTAAQPPQLLSGFFGFDLPGVPNDDDLAVSDAGQVVSVMNGRVAVHGENGTLLRVQSLGAFAGAPGAIGFDPHVLFDPLSQRFLVVFLTGRVASQSRIHVVVSATPDALGSWHAYQLSGNPLNDGTWTDYPGIALTQDELFITGNTFTDGSVNNTGFRQSTIWQLNKQRLVSGQPLQASDTRYYHTITHNGQPVFCKLPRLVGQ
ncbi:hypothetical protein [Hymenobacter sp. B81]|uniref:hypothetical protein n=1 Tax=Hymenobacter sp. B81 TaxID=3344878 RepID=UPI0037DC05AF